MRVLHTVHIMIDTLGNAVNMRFPALDQGRHMSNSDTKKSVIDDALFPLPHLFWQPV